MSKRLTISFEWMAQEKRALVVGPAFSDEAQQPTSKRG